jgi:DNA-binding beta-propeller fold protein YncE
MNVNAPPIHRSDAVRRSVLLTALLALALLAWPAAAGAAFFEYEGSFGSLSSPQGLATDEGGRVYVADPARGRVEVYDNASSGNTLVQTIGEGQLTSPVSVTVDNRFRIYVSDPGKGQVLQFESVSNGGKLVRTFGFPGSELGSLGNPRQIDTDRASQLYIAERDNGRVTIAKIQGRDILASSFFGATIGEVEGLTLDSKGRVFLSSDSAQNGEVRVIDDKGAVLGVVAGPGKRETEDDDGKKLADEDIEPAPQGRVNSPKQLARDRLNRVVVADSGNSRVQAFGSA